MGDGAGGSLGLVGIKKMSVTALGKIWTGVTIKHAAMLEATRRFIRAYHWRGPFELECIVNDDDVVLVDDHVSPAAAWSLVDEIKRLTPKPVRYVINTHFHYDHSNGNQIFGRNVDIIGHELTRQMLLGGRSLAMPLYQGYVTGIGPQIETLKGRLAAETDEAKRETLKSALLLSINCVATGFGATG